MPSPNKTSFCKNYQSNKKEFKEGPVNFTFTHTNMNYTNSCIFVRIIMLYNYVLLTILFCCVRDDVEEKIGENEQSELPLSLFPSSKQLERWEEAPEQRECVPNSCLSHWQVRKLDTCLTRQSHGGRQKKQRNEHQINVHIIRTTVLFAFPNICSSHPQLIVAEQMILFLFIQTAKKQTLKVFDELRLGILKTRGSTEQAWG